MEEIANYGLDAPGFVRNLGIIGVVSILVGAVVPGVRPALFTGTVFVVQTAYMVWGSRVGKRRQRDRLLDMVSWRGDESVLDVGCGRGLLLIGAARRVPRGRAVGIDKWQKEDLSGNTREATLSNAAAEGVADRVEVQTADMRTMLLPDATFDLVVSSLAVHNIYSVEGRRQALAEIVRVMKPGATLLLQDIRHTKQYAAALDELGLAGVRRSGRSFYIFPPPRIVSGVKPVKPVNR